MGKRRFIKHLPLMFAGLAMGLGVFINVNSSKDKTLVQETEAAIPSNYYSSITDSMSGTTLLSNLKSIINTSSVSVSYDWSRYEDADEDPSNSSNVILVYARNSVAKTAHVSGNTGWNREHTFPASKLSNTQAEKDNHIIFASDNKVNGARSNIKMGVVTGGTVVNDYNGNATTCRKTSSLFDPNNVARGIVARSTMYAAAMYEYDPEDNFESIATMLRWHLDYPVTSFDQGRNDKVYTNQHNRNPFVDHPEYACRIWGNTNSTTQSICGSSTPSGSVSISRASASLTVDQSTTINATSSDSSTISWSTSNPSVASISNSSSASGSNITITGVSAGSATITASATISGTPYTATCNVTVTASGGSGGSDSYSLVTSNSSLSNGDQVVLTTLQTDSNIRGVTGWNNSNDATVSTDTSSWMKYTVESASSSGFKLKDTTANSYIASPTGNHFKYDSSGGTVSVASDGKFVCNSRYLCINGTYYRCYTSVGSYTPFYIYKVTSSSAKTLSSISVSTAPTKTTYTAGEYFDPTGLVITRTYSDSTSDTYTYAGHTSDFTFSPTTSTALTTSNTSVTITYGGKSCNQAITVNSAAATSITATPTKTFYVGETISASNISVTDNNSNSVNSFNFANDGYQFTYADASSGGALTSKTFSNAITSGNLTCSLTVQVQRKNYVAPSEDDYSVSYTDLPTSYQTSTTERTAASGVKFIAYNLANYSSKMQFKASGGYFQTTQSMSLKSLTINNRETNALTVYGSTNGTSFSNSITGTNDVYDLTGYTYVKVMKNGSGAAYCASLTIVAGTLETPSNIANFIMYEDTNNQCTTKLGTAITYLGKLSSSDRTTFSGSSDYVISTARTRLNAWAASQGKTIDYEHATMSNRSGISLLNANNNSSAITLIIIISLVGTTSIGIFFYLRKKHEN